MDGSLYLIYSSAWCDAGWSSSKILRRNRRKLSVWYARSSALPALLQFPGVPREGHSLRDEPVIISQQNREARFDIRCWNASSSSTTSRSGNFWSNSVMPRFRCSSATTAYLDFFWYCRDSSPMYFTFDRVSPMIRCFYDRIRGWGSKGRRRFEQHDKILHHRGLTRPAVWDSLLKVPVFQRIWKAVFSDQKASSGSA